MRNKEAVFSDLNTKANNPRGSQWHKWDLHVHTPSSIVQHYGDPKQEKTWEKYYTDLENLPPEIKVIGVNDYFFLDGYSRLLEAKNNGRLRNIALLLPVIELRISNLVGHKLFRKVNFHVIFSNELSANNIKLFFLDKLRIEKSLEDGNEWHGGISHINELEEFGRAIKSSSPQEKRANDSDLVVGFNHTAFSIENIRETLDHNIFKGRFLTAVGLSEWDQLRWDGGSAVLKKDIINGSHLVFTSSPSQSKYYERKEQLIGQQVNSRLLDCSDAHFFSSSSEPNSLGNVSTWLKSDLTFQGLCHVTTRFDNRVYIGDYPPKLQDVERKKTKYIHSIEIKKKGESSLEEIWFDCVVPLNSGLVAIIGEQGNGKSALTDIIALCGNSMTEAFSFLHEDKFLDNQNKASEFIATLNWEDGTSSIRSLDENIKRSEVERVRYIPQSFFEAVTNEKHVQEGGRFYSEIKKAIFSHIDESDRLDCSNLDELISLRTKEIRSRLEMLRQDLKGINIKIRSIEKECSEENIESLQKKIQTRENEIEAHLSIKPIEKEKPDEDETVNLELGELRNKESKLIEKIDTSETTFRNYKKQHALLQSTVESIQNEIDKFKRFLNQKESELAVSGIEFETKLEQMISISFDASTLDFSKNRLSEDIKNLEEQLNPNISGSLKYQLEEIRKSRGVLETELKKAGQEYQKYLDNEFAWQAQLNEYRGNKDKVDSLEWLKNQLKEIRVEKPKILSKLEENRREKCGEIFEQLEILANIYKELTKSVQNHIKKNELTREKYKVEFNINLVEQNLPDMLFSVIKQSSGTYSGIQEGREKLREQISRVNFSDQEQTISFAEAILQNLKNNINNDPPNSMDLSDLKRQGKYVEDIYNLLFGLEYLSIQYFLSLNGKPLKMLSPGDRGILLLVFYLIVDRSEEPLIIDQPEGNLNNKAVYKNLVPVFEKARETRQIIIVTHNPNLAVVCDAEQIINAEIDFEDRNRVRYFSGSLENPKFNKLSLDILEGTLPAFNSRKNTYEQVVY